MSSKSNGPSLMCAYSWTSSTAQSAASFTTCQLHTSSCRCMVATFFNYSKGNSCNQETSVSSTPNILKITRYPGFSGHGVKCPILTTVVPGFFGDLICCTIRSKWGSFGDLYHTRINLLCVWNKLFLAEIKISLKRTRPVKSLWWQIAHMQDSNKWMEKSYDFLNNGTCRNTMVKPQTVRYWYITHFIMDNTYPCFD